MVHFVAGIAVPVDSDRVREEEEIVQPDNC